MTISKAWDWNKETCGIWLQPSEESYYLAERWKCQGYSDLLDFGCGRGRHSVFFAQKGFRVSAFDLSAEGVGHLQKWAAAENLSIDVRIADMLSLPYAAHSFDCIFAYHVISHTNADGARTIMSEIHRILRPGGELYLTLCSKESGSFHNPAYPRIDENTILKKGGTEDGVPHYYSDLDEALSLLAGFDINHVRHIDDCYFEGKKQKSAHFFILAKKPAE
jgi:SAM-dependent methyltransferase